MMNKTPTSSLSRQDIDHILAQSYPDGEPIAVIGYACRFGQAKDSQTFWHHLVEGQELSCRFSRQQLLDAGIPAQIIDDPSYVNVGYELNGADEFDASLFGYSPQEAESIDPQQRLFLQTAWHALEHAGYAPGEVAHKTGVFAAARQSTYPGRDTLDITRVAQVRGMQSLLGNDKDYIATRVAYKLNLKGPALSVQTACSSSLVAVHLACESLHSGEAEMAIAGGAALSFPLQTGYLHQPGMIFSADGHCRPFDVDAQGTFPGHGVGAVVLRRLGDALADGDPIIALLPGSAINNDGQQKVGYTAPSVSGQQSVIEEAMLFSGIDSRQIGLIEAHGTATPLGDPIEIEALRQVFHPPQSAPDCALGSVKGNLGHLDTAAGIASLIKAILAVEHAVIPPSLHFKRPNPALKLETTPFYIPTQATPWQSDLRIAGVSSFGIGGTNCHMLVSSLPPSLLTAMGDLSRSAGHTQPEHVLSGGHTTLTALTGQAPLLLSAASPDSLRRLAGRYAQSLSPLPSPQPERQSPDESQPTPHHLSNMNNLAYTALHGRRLDLPYRLATVLSPESDQALQAFASGEADILIHSGQAGDGKQVWLFTGQGSHWAGMGKAMYHDSPVFAEWLDRCTAACEMHSPSRHSLSRHSLSLKEAMFSDDASHLQDMGYAQPAIVAFELAMAAHWQAKGLQPDIVIGHSVGEYAAAAVAGYYTPEQIMPLVCHRGALMQQCTKGGMVAVFAETTAILPLSEEFGLDIAAYNGPRHLVLSGMTDSIERCLAELTAQGIAHRRLSVTGAAHSMLLEPILDQFQSQAQSLQAVPGQIPLISTALGVSIDEVTLNQPHYWRDHMRHPVRFIQAIEAAKAQGATLFLELGPDAQLSLLGQRNDREAIPQDSGQHLGQHLGQHSRAENRSPDGSLNHPQCHWIATARRHQHQCAAQEQQTLIQLFAAGMSLPWHQLLTIDGHKIHAPLYPFAPQRHWRDQSHLAIETTKAKATETSPVIASAIPIHPALVTGQKVAQQAARDLDLPRLQRLYDCATELHAIYVDQLVRHCVGSQIETGIDALSILRQGHLLPRYRQLLVRLLNACVTDGYYQCDQGQYRSLGHINGERCDVLLESLAACCEGFTAIPQTIARAGSQLYEMMNGTLEPVSVIFPEGSSSGVEVLYQDFSFGRYFNQIAAGVMKGMMHARHEKRPWKILEVGGGTGGTTRWLLPELVGQPSLRYEFTDISALFTRRAQEKFAEYDFVDYREFDLQKPAAAQGFVAGQYDLIVAANVIHATQHVGRTLDNLKPLLKPGGHLLMREITQPMRLFDFVFGPLVLPLHDLDARDGELFLNKAQWESHCHQAGFEQVVTLPASGQTATMSEHIILATLPGGTPFPEQLPRSGDWHPILGQSLSDHGEYLADWSDCAGDPQRWQTRLQQASVVLAERHGTRYQPLNDTCPEQAPAWLSTVRLHWQAAVFRPAHIQLEAYNPEIKGWQALSISPGQTAALDPIAAPETHYQWQWHPIETHQNDTEAMSTETTCTETTCTKAMSTETTWLLLPPHDATSLEKCPSPEKTPSLEKQRLNEQGIRFAGLVQKAGKALGEETGTEAGNRLLVLPEHAAPHELAALVSDAIQQDDQPLVVITQSGWPVTDGEPINISHHAIWGFIRVAANESPKRLIAAIDVPAQHAWDGLAGVLSAITPEKRWFAIREGQGYIPHLITQHYTAPSLPEQAFASEQWHVITGAFGGLGQLTQQWLIRHGARKIALLAPRPHGDWPVEQTHRYIEQCEVRWINCDVADTGQLQDALYTLQSQEGIAGVIHTAGILDDVPVMQLTQDRLKQVMAVKADAAHQIWQSLQTHQGQYLILYSSAAAAMGASGQGAHALASGWLDGLALSQANQSSPVTLSVAWGAWRDTGRAAERDILSHLAAQGMESFCDAEGIWHLQQTVMQATPYRLAMRVCPDKMPALQQSLFTAADDTSAEQPLSTASEQDAERPQPQQTDAAHLPEQVNVRDAQAVAHWLTQRITSQLRLNAATPLSQAQDLFLLGLDSLLFLELSSDIERQFGIRLSAETAYQDLSIRGLTQHIQEMNNDEADDLPESVRLEHHEASLFEPFPLTPIQHAYWLGRTEMIEYGGVACHVVFEWDKCHQDFDLQRFENAWNQLISHHDMLRMVIDPEGRQRILPQVPHYSLKRRHLQDMSFAQQQQALLETRHELSYQVLPTDRWPLFELVVSELDPQHYRLHMNLDLLLFDVQSFKVMMDDLAALYQGETLTPLPVTFRDYVMAEQAQRQQPEWLRAWTYWQDRLPQLPPAPQLSCIVAAPVTRPSFTTYQGRLSRTAWQQLKTLCQSQGVTPSATLLTLFAYTLERWSRSPDFTLNLTFFNRQQVHPQINRLIGDFTSVLLMDFALGQPLPLAQAIAQTQQRLWQHLSHSQVNGVELIRELGKQRAAYRQPQMPIVFTSMLGMTLEGMTIDQAMTHLLGDPCHVFTQTPQVWLDHQVMEIEGELIFSWYCMDDVFEGDSAQQMFDDYQALLAAVVQSPDCMADSVLKRVRPDGQLEEFTHQSWPLPGIAALDQRVLEQTVCELPEIHAASITDATPHHIELCVVASDEPENTASSSSLQSVIPPALDKTTLRQIESTWQWLENKALQGIAATLSRHQLFTDEARHETVERVAAALSAEPQYKRLIRQWLQLLCEQGWLTQSAAGYSCTKPLTARTLPLASPPDSAWGNTLSQYLDNCLAHHHALLTGQKQPLELLFGDNEVTEALYSQNPVMQSLHDYAVRIACALSEKRRDFQVMEVGAGTAATTRHLLPALENRLQRYHFTDVSPLFLEEAKQRFAAQSTDKDILSVGLFDLNRPVDFSVHPETGYDLLVAVNVLHDAQHVVHALRRLRHLLKPGAHLILIEATERNSALQLASIGFIEGLNGYQDLRIADDKPMLDLPMWQQVLQQAGFIPEICWPEEEQTALRQHLILARASATARLDTDRIQQHLQSRFDLPPLRIQQVERLGDEPDRVKLDAVIKSAETDIQAQETLAQNSPAVASPLENQVAQIWQTLLARPVNRHSDFFTAGGDSLMATRMVAQLNQQGISGATLQSLFTTPTLAGFCQTLQSSLPASRIDSRLDNRHHDSHNNNNNNNSNHHHNHKPNPICLVQGSHQDTLFFFHASDGDPSVYLPQAKALDRQAFGLHADNLGHITSLSALAESYTAEIRRQQPQGPYTLVGWSYGAFTAASAAVQLKHAGESVRLICLDPVCREDFRFADRTALLHLLARGPVDLSLSERLADMNDTEQMQHFIGQAQAAGMIPPTYSFQQAQVWLERTEHLLRLLADHSHPAAVDIPCLQIHAANRPEHWHSAERDWSSWHPYSEHRQLHTTHWGLVTDPHGAQQCAEEIRHWLANHLYSEENKV